jgi:alpha-glucosidase (family GH31 glycosyl hydrolase)
MKKLLRFSVMNLLPLLILALMTGNACALPANPVVLGSARFTVITPECIRMEYAPVNGFVDAPTLFAVNRNTRDTGAKIILRNGRLTIRTSRMELIYIRDGHSFDAVNLQVTFRNKASLQSWAPGQVNSGNLGGPVATLDGVTGPLDLPQGLISRDGWALVDDSGEAIIKHDWIAPRPGGGPANTGASGAPNQDIDWYLFAYGSDYHGALQSLAAISGRAAMPRREVLGSWYCRWFSYTANDFKQIVQGYSAHNFPLDILVMDMGWHTQDATAGKGWSNNLGWTGYTWNRKLIPHPKQLLQEFHKDGIFVTLNDHPADGIRSNEECYPKFMSLMGDSPASGINLPFDDGSKRYMKAFFAASHTPLEKEGVDFWWLDWQQDSIFPWVIGVPGLRHLPWLNKLYYDHTEKSGLRGQIYSRWGGWGEQKYPIQFSGDAGAFWSLLGFEIPFTTASGNSGCFYWAHDTGAIWGPRDPEMYARWTQFSGFSASLRVHSMGDVDRRPWLWGKPYEDSMRTIYHLRSQLFPYIYTSARECYDQTIPLLRPMYIDFPNKGQAYHYPDEYLFGDNILAAPITSAGTGPGMVASQGVWFPDGPWYNLFTGEQDQGNSEALVSADIMESPIFVRGGTPIPVQPYTPRMTTTPLKALRVRCYPGKDGKTGYSTLYEDDGRTNGYLKGEFARTRLLYTRHGDTVIVKIGAASGHFKGQVTKRSVIVELADTTRAKRALVNGKNHPFQYDAVNQMNRVILPALPVNAPLNVTIYCGLTNFHALREKAIARRIQGILGKRTSTQSLSNVLNNAGNITSEQEKAIMAVYGVGITKDVDGKNFLTNKPRYTFYAPKGALDDNSVIVSNGIDSGTRDSILMGVLHAGGVGTSISVPRVSFRIGGEPHDIAGGPMIWPGDVALDAHVTASGSEQGYSPQGAIDGIIGGYPESKKIEWSAGGTADVWIKLDWDTPQVVSRVDLYDRPNLTDQVTGGILTFSDGSSVKFGALPNDGQTGLSVNFPAKTINWMKITITSVKPGTQNAGLSEIAVYPPGSGALK